MASTTPNIGLTKPAGTEQALISAINGDMDIIDSKMGAVPQNKNVQEQIDSLSDQIAIHTVQYDVQTGFSLESWGKVNICVTGNLLIINAGGLKSTNVVSGDTPCIKMKNFSFTRVDNAYGVVWESNNTIGIAQIFDNSGEIQVGRIGTANTVFSFSMVVPLSSYSFS